MFKNSIVLGSSREVKKKDAKHLASSIAQYSSNLDSFPRAIIEVSVPAVDRAVIFQSKEDNAPIAFKIGSQDTIPTLYCLWAYGCILPVVYVNEYCSEYILNGAHLMLPGILTQRQGSDFTVSKLVAVLVAGNPMPIAIGHAEMSADQIRSSKPKTRGKAVTIVHYFGDGLWQMGSRFIPPGFSFSRVVPMASLPSPEIVLPLVSHPALVVAPPCEASLMDEFIVCSFCSLCQTLTPDDLPMNASSLLSRIQAASKLLLESKSFMKKNNFGPISRIDLKNSSFKKFSDLIAFLDPQFIKTKFVHKELIILSINFANERVRNFVQPLEKKEKVDIPQSIVHVWYVLHSKWQSVFPDWPREGSRSELCKKLTDLLKTVSGEFVSDSSIFASLFSKTMSKKDIVHQFNSSLIPMYSLSNELPPRARRGDPPKVTVHVRRIQGNKFCTNIAGLESGYKLDESNLASEISKQFALTASAVDGGIYCQGNLADKLSKFLTEKIGIPIASIEVKKPMKK